MGDDLVEQRLVASHAPLFGQLLGSLDLPLTKAKVTLTFGLVSPAALRYQRSSSSDMGSVFSTAPASSSSSSADRASHSLVGRPAIFFAGLFIAWSFVLL